MGEEEGFGAGDGFEADGVVDEENGVVEGGEVLVIVGGLAATDDIAGVRGVFVVEGSEREGGGAGEGKVTRREEVGLNCLGHGVSFDEASGDMMLKEN
jgi:hypothetical protein